MRRLLLCSIAIMSCRPETKVAEIPRVNMLTLVGALRLTGDVTKLPDIGGDVHLTVYSRGDEGYCLRRGAVLAEAQQLIRTPAKSDLTSGTATYSVKFEEPPGQTYPVTLFVTAEWQTTRARIHACETDTLFGVGETRNAFAAYGISGDEADTSACCHFFPQPLQLTGPGTVLENVDLTLTVRTTAPCSDPLARGDACYMRRNQDGTETACALALGTTRDDVLRDRDGNVCD
jgi:hypothetical protein